MVYKSFFNFNFDRFIFHEYTKKINDFVTFGFPFETKGEFKGKFVC